MTLAELQSWHRSRRAPLGITLFVSLLALLVLGWIVWPDAFFPAYWFALMFWVQLSLGCLSLLLIQFLTGGEWGRASAPFLRRGASGLLLLLPLFLPAFLALPHIFSWTTINPDVSVQVLVNKQAWLNPTAFILRAIFFLAVLTGLTLYWRRPGWSVGTIGTGWSGPALVAVVLVLSFASCDWLMSIEPTFYSSLYPFMYFSGAMVGTLSALCAIFAFLQVRSDVPVRPELLHALGKLLFAAVLFWGYIVFSQFIIIWTGNLPDEADWYVIRANHGWQWLTLFVVLFHFAIPFCLLLSQKLKREPRRLLRISAALFVVHFAEVYWMMAPKKGVGFYLNPFDLLLPPLIGACWLWFAAGIPATSAETAAALEPAP
jgi:hypothetical protein